MLNAEQNSIVFSSLIIIISEYYLVGKFRSKKHEIYARYSWELQNV